MPSKVESVELSRLVNRGTAIKRAVRVVELRVLLLRGQKEAKIVRGMYSRGTAVGSKVLLSL